MSVLCVNKSGWAFCVKNVCVFLQVYCVLSWGLGFLCGCVGVLCVGERVFSVDMKVLCDGEWLCQSVRVQHVLLWVTMCFLC